MARSNKAADVRKFVQKINLTRGQAEERFDDLNGADADGEYHDEDAVYDENAREMGNRAVQENAWEHYGNPEDTRDGQSEDQGPSQSRSKWAPYASVLAQRERTQPRYGLGDAGDGSAYDDEVVEEDFVTMLPGNRSREKGKGKRRNGRECTAPTMSKRRGFATANNMKEDDFGGRTARDKGFERRWEPPHRKQKPSATAKNNGQLRQSRWNDDAPLPRTELRNDDFGDGTFTSLGQDEVVNDDVHE